MDVCTVFPCPRHGDCTSGRNIPPITTIELMTSPSAWVHAETVVVRGSAWLGIGMNRVPEKSTVEDSIIEISVAVIPTVGISVSVTLGKSVALVGSSKVSVLKSMVVDGSGSSNGTEENDRKLAGIRVEDVRASPRGSTLALAAEARRKEARMAAIVVRWKGSKRLVIAVNRMLEG